MENENLKRLKQTAELIEKYDFIISKQTKDFASLVKHIEKISGFVENINKEIQKQADKQNNLFLETEKKFSVIEEKQVKIIRNFEKTVEKKITDIIYQLNEVEKRVSDLNRRLLLSVSEMLNKIIQKFDELNTEV